MKTRKEAKKMAIKDSISATKAKMEELKRAVEEHKARKDQCAAIISQQDIGNYFHQVDLLPYSSTPKLSMLSINFMEG